MNSLSSSQGNEPILPANLHPFAASQKQTHKEQENFDILKIGKESITQKKDYIISKKPDPHIVNNQPDSNFSKDKALTVKNIPLSSLKNVESSAVKGLPPPSKDQHPIGKNLDQDNLASLLDDLFPAEDTQISKMPANERTELPSDETDEVSLEDDLNELEDDLNEIEEDNAEDTRFELKITGTDLTAIKSYFSAKKGDLETLTVPTLFRHSETKLTYTVLYMPQENPASGVYILLKTKGGHQEVGSGAASKVTLLLNINVSHPEQADTLMAIRSARKEDLNDSESEINEIIVKSGSKHLVAGNSFNYRGAWSPREESGDSLQVKDTEKVAFIMPLIKGKNLNELIEDNLPEQATAIDWAIQMTEALADLHRLKIVHGDIKPENYIKSDDGSIKLCDFGSASVFDEESHLGTKGFMRPGMIYEKANPSNDIFALGCTLTELFYGSALRDEFVSSNGKLYNDPEDFKFIKTMIFPNLKTEGHIDDIINKCLSLNPEESPKTVDEILQMLKHYRDKL